MGGQASKAAAARSPDATEALKKTPDGAELLSLEGLGIPDSMIIWYQATRASFGIGAPSEMGLFGWGIVLMVLMSVIFSFLSGFIMWFIYVIFRGFTGGLRTNFQALVFCLTVSFLIGVLAYYWYVKPYETANNIQLGKEFANAIGVEGFQSNMATATATATLAKMTDAPVNLLNLQSIGVKQIGYLGPNASGGSFDPATQIQAALRVGIRCFTLQIDTLENNMDPKLFDKVGVPTLLYRDDSGKLVSTNGANLTEVATTLSTYAFSPQYSNSDLPIILYLHFVKTPNQFRNPEKYVTYLSTVAKALAPLFPSIVGSLPDGSFQRQQNELGFLNLPITSLQKKVVFMANVDTSVFRNLQPLGMKQYESNLDLDYFINMRVYLDSSSDKFGATTTPIGGAIANAVIVPFNRLADMSPDEQDAFAQKGKSRFVIVMPKQYANPELAPIKTVITRTGANWINMSLFGESMDSLKAKMALWGGEPFLHMKSKNYLAPKSNTSIESGLTYDAQEATRSLLN